MYHVGDYGFGWSSTTMNTIASSLLFHENGTYSNSSNNRSHGFQLRCLQE
ncbi:MAG: hypothetical protein K2G93_08635 [Rikenella sp.]|nr:hypothetical protein [Rikenella sp.]